MGYYTRFNGTVDGPEEFLQEFRDDARANGTFGTYGIMLDEWLMDEFFYGEPSKWYTCEDDVIEVSTKYPGLLFTVDGEGEESGDIWRMWARHGRCLTASAEIVFPTPDLDKELPAPNAKEITAKRREAEIAAIDAEIAKLIARRDSL